VTAGAYAACVARGACLDAANAVNAYSSDATNRAWSAHCNGGKPGREKHPMNCVSYLHAAGYCRAMGGRLPTEAEWELAATGGDGRPFPWGNAPPTGKLVNACGPECVPLLFSLGEAAVELYPDSDGFPATAPVGSFPAGASPFGLLDLAGNVREWTSSNTPDRADAKITRGGYWATSSAAGLRAQDSSWSTTNGSYTSTGFRCAFDAPGGAAR
jgi:formylglycine-generating enzyme required for sulfatase activity